MQTDTLRLHGSQRELAGSSSSTPAVSSVLAEGEKVIFNSLSSTSFVKPVEVFVGIVAAHPNVEVKAGVWLRFHFDTSGQKGNVWSLLSVQIGFRCRSFFFEKFPWTLFLKTYPECNPL